MFAFNLQDVAAQLCSWDAMVLYTDRRARCAATGNVLALHPLVTPSDCLFLAFTSPACQQMLRPPADDPTMSHTAK